MLPGLQYVCAQAALECLFQTGCRIQERYIKIKHSVLNVETNGTAIVLLDG